MYRFPLGPLQKSATDIAITSEHTSSSIATVSVDNCAKPQRVFYFLASVHDLFVEASPLEKAIMMHPRPWIAVSTTSKGRMNIFCVEPREQRHVVSVIAASKKRVDQFRVDVELMRSAPELLTLLGEAAEAMREMNHVLDPKFIALRRRMASKLSSLQALNPTGSPKS